MTEKEPHGRATSPTTSSMPSKPRPANGRGRRNRRNGIPAMIRYRASRMTKEPRTTQKEAAWQIMEEAYMAASGNGTLPALARQIYYQARPKIMAMTEDKELAYGYFSQTLLPDYIEEHGVDWNVVYDARGHFEEPHTNRRIGCGTIEVGNYLHAMKEPKIVPAEFSDANVDIIGPSGDFSASIVLRKGRVWPAVQGGEPRQPLRSDDHLDQGRIRHRREAADRRHLRRQRPSAVRAARLRRCRVS